MSGTKIEEERAEKDYQEEVPDAAVPGMEWVAPLAEHARYVPESAYEQEAPRSEREPADSEPLAPDLILLLRHWLPYLSPYPIQSAWQATFTMFFQ